MVELQSPSVDPLNELAPRFNSLDHPQVEILETDLNNDSELNGGKTVSAEELVPVPRPTMELRRYVSSILVSLAVLSIGTSIGWMSPAMEKLPHIMKITDGQMGWLSGVHEFGRIVFSILGLVDSMWEKISPTWSLTMGSLLVILNWVLIATTANVPILFLARFLVGCAMGFVYVAVPLYISDVAPPQTRGALSTLFQFMLYSGHEVAYILGLETNLSYRQIAYASCGFALLWCLSTLILIESPTYLVKKRNIEKARKSIRFLSGTKDKAIVEHELAKIQKQLDDSSNQKKGTFKELFLAPNRFKVAIICGVALSERFAGMNSVVNYAAETFPSTAGGLSSTGYTLVFGAIVPISTLFATTLLDLVGRRPLLIVSCVGAFVAHTVTAIGFGLGDRVTWLPFASITTFSIFYAIGLGPIMNTLQGEVPPPHLKWAASSLMILFHAIGGFISSKLFQVLAEQISFSLAFGIFAAFCGISAVLIYMTVPETKGTNEEAMEPVSLPNAKIHQQTIESFSDTEQKTSA